MDRTLVVGDVHISADQNLRRAEWLGRFIADTKPDRVVYIGDYATFDSLSAWDKDKRLLMEGRRFSKDVDAIKKFNDMVHAASGTHTDYQSIITEGNHEYRIDRYVQYNPEMEGSLDYKKLAGIEHWKSVPYKQFYNYRGIDFTHVPLMENGRPVSGKYAVSRCLAICNRSVVFGHTHQLDYKALHRHGGKHLQEALNVGCYFEHVDDYAMGSCTSYWRGLVLLTHYTYGRFGFETVPMGMLRREYSKVIKAKKK